MDTVALILTALQIGPLVDGIDNRALNNDAVKDAYENLKLCIQQKFAGKKSAEVVLAEYSADPKTWETPLKKSLVEMQVDQDEDIIAAAQLVIKLGRPEQAGTGKYNVQISGNVQGFAQGDYQNVTIHFGDEKAK
jgi:hypothetical protein